MAGAIRSLAASSTQAWQTASCPPSGAEHVAPQTPSKQHTSSQALPVFLLLLHGAGFLTSPCPATSASKTAPRALPGKNTSRHPRPVPTDSPLHTATDPAIQRVTQIPSSGPPDITAHPSQPQRENGGEDENTGKPPSERKSDHSHPQGFAGGNQS